MDNQPEIELTGNVRIICDVCGEELEGEFRRDGGRWHGLNIKPCEKCIEKAREEEKEKGA